MPIAVRQSVWPLVVLLTLLYLSFELGAKQSYVPAVHMGSGVLRLEYVPDPNDIVNLAEGTPYVVPPGKILIITDWVTTDAEVVHSSSSLDHPVVQPRIRIDGNQVWGGGFSASERFAGNGGAASSTGTCTLEGSLASGIRAEPGATVTLETVTSSGGWFGNPTTFASGYLADEK
jgi:hypothetical protein